MYANNEYDIKIRLYMFYSTMQSSRSGRKLNQAVQNTSRAVASTGKVVGMYLKNIMNLLFSGNYNYIFI